MCYVALAHQRTQGILKRQPGFQARAIKEGIDIWTYQDVRPENIETP
jgi:hypothetical protein